MRDRLGHAEEHQADAHAGREQHREPSRVGVIGRRFLATEPDVPERRDDEQKAEGHEDVARQDEEPVEMMRQPVAHRAKKRGRGFWEHQRAEHEGDDAEPGHEEDRVVDVEPERPELGLDVVLADLVIDIRIHLDGFDVCHHVLPCRFAPAMRAKHAAGKSQPDPVLNLS